jgi:hypothetical protein
MLSTGLHFASESTACLSLHSEAKNLFSTAASKTRSPVTMDRRRKLDMLGW